VLEPEYFDDLDESWWLVVHESWWLVVDESWWLEVGGCFAVGGCCCCC
jgi:hypothetical protein